MKRSTMLAILTLLLATTFSAIINTQSANAVSVDQVSHGAGGRVHGNIYGFNVYDELITVSWASVTAMQSGQTIDKAYSSDGFYEMYLPSGTFDLVVEAQGFFTEEMNIYIGDGSDYALNFYMERNNQPIPEFPISAIQLIALLSLTVTLLILRRKTFPKTRTSQP